MALSKIQAESMNLADTYAFSGTVSGTSVAGNVVQVKEGRLTSQFSTSSTSFVNTGLGLAITPTDNNNKILLTANFCFYHANAFAIATILRDSTNLEIQSGQGLAQIHAGSSQGSSASMHILDNPQTTSEISYTCHMLVQSGTGYFNINTCPAFITAMEIVV